MHCVCITISVIIEEYGTDLSAEKKEKKADARVFKAHKIPRRKECASKKKSEETEAIKRVNAPAVLIRVVMHAPGERRAVISISKKILKSAAARNLIKRRIRVILQPLLPRATGKLVVTVKRNATPLSFGELKKELLREAERSGIV